MDIMTEIQDVLENLLGCYGQMVSLEACSKHAPEQHGGQLPWCVHLVKAYLNDDMLACTALCQQFLRRHVLLTANPA